MKKHSGSATFDETALAQARAGTWKYPFDEAHHHTGETMKEIQEVYVKTHFSAAHCREGYPGDCVRRHGHNWISKVDGQCVLIVDVKCLTIGEHEKNDLASLDRHTTRSISSSGTGAIMNLPGGSQHRFPANPTRFIFRRSSARSRRTNWTHGFWKRVSTIRQRMWITNLNPLVFPGVFWNERPT